MTDLAAQSKRKIAETAAQMLAGTISFIVGARRISRFGYEAGIHDDPDILPFIGIDSETDALPLDPEIRRHWSPVALEKLQPEIDRAEEWAKQFGTPYCERLVTRFTVR